jgi:tryptophanyl-tRNA synthetase
MKIKRGNDFKLEPWGSSAIVEEDYIRLNKEFGIEEIDEEIVQKMRENRFMRRKIMFGHQDLQYVLKAIENNQPWAVMSGISSYSY